MELKEVFEPVFSFVKTFQKKDREVASKQAAKDRLKLVLMQDRASVSPDFFDMMKKELIDVIKKYIEIDEESLEVELTRGMEVGLEGPALYANIPIKNVKPVAPQGELDEMDMDMVSELSEERVDAAAEQILSQIEELAKKNKEELLMEQESEEYSTPSPIGEERTESFVTEDITKNVDKAVENTEVTVKEETKVEEITPTEEPEEKPKAVTKKKTTTKKAATKKKKEE